MEESDQRPLRPWITRRWMVAAIAPFEVLLSALIGTWEGACEGVDNVRSAWREF